MTVTLDIYFIVVTGALDAIADALEADSELGRPARVLVAPGSEIAWDGCDCGQLALIFKHGPYPSPSFPVEADQNVGRCGTVDAIQVQASLTWCAYHPAPASQGQPPSADAQTAAARLQMRDEFIMRNALYCYLQAQLNATVIDDFRIGASDYANDGACGEVSTMFWFQVI